MLDDGADEALLLELLHRGARQTAIDAQAICQDGRRDHLVLWRLNQQLLVGLLVEENRVVELVPAGKKGQNIASGKHRVGKHRNEGVNMFFQRVSEQEHAARDERWRDAPNAACLVHQLQHATPQKPFK